MDIEKLWSQAAMLSDSFTECRTCIKEVYALAAEIVQSPPDTPEQFRITMDPPSPDVFYLKKNIFSTLFQSIYHILDIEPERRLLYGTLNYLFRVWVTSADNLLDDEDKVVLALRLPASAHTMRQVIAIMAADRVLKHVLDQAVTRRIIPGPDSRRLADRSLQVLLPSAAEEASEENGVGQRPRPDYVLYTIHRLKTGLLFHIPFVGPDTVESGIDIDAVRACKSALNKFGLGCQLLDDIRDLAGDYLQNRHNYLLSTMYWADWPVYSSRLETLARTTDADSRIFAEFPEITYPAAQVARDLLQSGLRILAEQGIGISGKLNELMVWSMFELLGVGELCDVTAAID